VETLLERAEQMDLYEDEYWRTLLHYKRTPFGTKSLIDDPKFFLAADGRIDPESELKATIRALFQEEGNETEEVICRFIGRYVWLREKLGADEIGIPVTTCRKFQQTMDRIKPRAATLIFPTSFINSPASMFGHTLLRIETGYESKLLSQAVNYSATTKEEISKGEYSEVFLKTLRARSELGTPREASSDIPVPVEPTQGHKSNKVCVAYGMTDLDEELDSLKDEVKKSVFS